MWKSALIRLDLNVPSNFIIFVIFNHEKIKPAEWIIDAHACKNLINQANIKVKGFCVRIVKLIAWTIRL